MLDVRCSSSSSRVWFWVQKGQKNAGSGQLKVGEPQSTQQVTDLGFGGGNEEEDLINEIFWKINHPIRLLS